MPARAFRHALALLLVVGALLVVSLWSMRDEDVRAEEQPQSGISEGQANSGTYRWTDPMTMYEAYAMGSPSFGSQQSFWNKAINR